MAPLFLWVPAFLLFGQTHAVFRDDAADSSLLSFHDFVQKHGRTYTRGSEEYKLRQSMFEKHLAEIEVLNQQPDQSAQFGVTSLADRTEQELEGMRGYNPLLRPSGGGGGSLAWRVAQRHRGSLNKTKLPADFSWLGKLKSMKDIKDQGSCGSCWAIGAVSVLNAHAELYDLPRRFSTQQIVSCTPNPMECGGKGGCDGATAELAMQHVLQADLLSEDEFPYQAHDLACPTSVKEKMGTMLIQGATTSFGMHGYKTLPQNKVKPLLDAVYNQGPVAVSMAATSGFSWYTSGIFSNCDSWIVNHLVTLVGFGQASSAKKYWVIQNSWGNYWGENGFMKITRLDDKAEDENCGWDLKPEDGIGCKGGPSKVWVCGSCGITFDSVVPNFKLKKSGWWATKAGRKPDM